MEKHKIQASVYHLMFISRAQEPAQFLMLLWYRVSRWVGRLGYGMCMPGDAISPRVSLKETHPSKLTIFYSIIARAKGS